MAVTCFEVNFNGLTVVTDPYITECVDDPVIIEILKNEYLRLVPDGIFVSPKHGEWVEL